MLFHRLLFQPMLMLRGLLFNERIPGNVILILSNTYILITYLSRMEFPFLINLTSPFPWLQLDGIFHFYSNLDRTVCKQTVETLIRRRIVWRLIWVCTVCLCPTKWMLGLYGLTYMHGYPGAYCLCALENQRLCRTVRIRRLV